MFNKKLKERIEEIEDILTDPKKGNIGSELDYLEARIDKIEEQLEPEPKFKKGDLVHFFLAGNEFDGEIVGRDSCRDSWSYNYYPSYVNIETNDWRIKYLDKNDVAQYVNVNEKDIWRDEDDCIDCLFSEIEDLRLRLKKLEDNKKK